MLGILGYYTRIARSTLLRVITQLGMNALWDTVQPIADVLSLTLP